MSLVLISSQNTTRADSLTLRAHFRFWKPYLTPRANDCPSRRWEPQAPQIVGSRLSYSPGDSLSRMILKDPDP